ncbi:allophanate hydrolase subunit 1 [Pseudonocardiaceae bacterium YIM PH 21723]|nr:allophanate hydrolase subunit 1 [Pseudonocardiaceae bacterium YIM PH 21723]
MRVLPYGDRAVLIEVDTLDQVRAVHSGLLGAKLGGVVDLVPAARTVLVTFSRPAPTCQVRSILESVDLTAVPAAAGRELVIPVHYDGPDLDLVARTAGLSTAEVIELHTSAGYSVAFTGFAPGFGYLTGLPAPLRQSRLDSPRATVPSGAVGIAGEFTGVYPKSSPGGWRLLGHTELTMFDARRDPAALLAPGDRVRFEVAS